MFVLESAFLNLRERKVSKISPPARYQYHETHLTICWKKRIWFTSLAVWS